MAWVIARPNGYVSNLMYLIKEKENSPQKNAIYNGRGSIPVIDGVGLMECEKFKLMTVRIISRALCCDSNV
jgi:hypothetical protein